MATEIDKVDMMTTWRRSPHVNEKYRRLCGHHMANITATKGYISHTAVTDCDVPVHMIWVKL